MRWRALSLFAILIACGGNSKPVLNLVVDGSGAVTSEPAGILCTSGTCQAAFAAGSAVTLTAHRDAKASFTGWNGACSGTQLTCSVTMSANTSVGAFFSKPANSKLISISLIGVGVVRSDPPGIDCPPDCAVPFATGSTVTLTEIPQAGSTFKSWSGACSGSTATCVLAMNGEQDLLADFTAPANAHKVTVTITGEGSVTSSPAGINCPSETCGGFFTDGTSVALSAIPDPSQSFAGWTGACSGTAPCTVSVSADSTVGATFTGSGY